jgi:hypothetical protein
VLLLLTAIGGFWLVPSAQAAEVLQVRKATLLQVGDQNRSYGVELACVALPADQLPAATAWLRHELPRRTRVNLRPQGSDGGLLLARVVRLDRGSELAADLVAAGYGQWLPECAA